MSDANPHETWYHVKRVAIYLSDFSVAFAFASKIVLDIIIMASLWNQFQTYSFALRYALPSTIILALWAAVTMCLTYYSYHREVKLPPRTPVGEYPVYWSRSMPPWLVRGLLRTRDIMTPVCLAVVGIVTPFGLYWIYAIDALLPGAANFFGISGVVEYCYTLGGQLITLVIEFVPQIIIILCLYHTEKDNGEQKGRYRPIRLHGLAAFEYYSISIVAFVLLRFMIACWITRQRPVKHLKHQALTLRTGLPLSRLLMDSLVDLSFCQLEFTEARCQAFRETLMDNPNVREIIMHRANINHGMMASLTELLVTKPQLWRVDLSSNAHVGDAGALQVATALLSLPKDSALYEVVMLDTGMTRAASRVLYIARHLSFCHVGTYNDASGVVTAFANAAAFPLDLWGAFCKGLAARLRGRLASTAQGAPHHAVRVGDAALDEADVVLSEDADGSPFELDLSYCYLTDQHLEILIFELCATAPSMGNEALEGGAAPPSAAVAVRGATAASGLASLDLSHNSGLTDAALAMLATLCGAAAGGRFTVALAGCDNLSLVELQRLAASVPPSAHRTSSVSVRVTHPLLDMDVQAAKQTLQLVVPERLLTESIDDGKQGGGTIMAVGAVDGRGGRTVLVEVDASQEQKKKGSDARLLDVMSEALRSAAVNTADPFGKASSVSSDAVSPGTAGEQGSPGAAATTPGTNRWSKFLERPVDRARQLKQLQSDAVARIAKTNKDIMQRAQDYQDTHPVMMYWFDVFLQVTNHLVLVIDMGCNWFIFSRIVTRHNTDVIPTNAFLILDVICLCMPYLVAAFTVWWYLLEQSWVVERMLLWAEEQRPSQLSAARLATTFRKTTSADGKSPSAASAGSSGALTVAHPDARSARRSIRRPTAFCLKVLWVSMVTLLGFPLLALAMPFMDIIMICDSFMPGVAARCGLGSFMPSYRHTRFLINALFGCALQLVAQISVTVYQHSIGESDYEQLAAPPGWLYPNIFSNVYCIIDTLILNVQYRKKLQMPWPEFLVSVYRMGGEAGMPLAAVRDNQLLGDLELHDVPVSRQSLLSLHCMLRNNCSMSGLILQNVDLGPGHVDTLVQLLTSSPFLEVVDLARNPELMTMDSAMRLAAALCRLPANARLRRLVLRGCGVVPPAAAKLLHAAALRVGCDVFCDDGKAAAAAAAAVAPVDVLLWEEFLRSYLSPRQVVRPQVLCALNPLTPEELQAYATKGAAVPDAKGGLTVKAGASASGNMAGVPAKSASSAVSKKSSTAEVGNGGGGDEGDDASAVSDIKVYPAGVPPVPDGAAAATDVEVDFSGCGLTDEHVAVLVVVAEGVGAVLAEGGNEAAPAAEAERAAALAVRRSITALDLSHNPIGAGSVPLLPLLAVHLPRLQRLEVVGCPLGTAPL